MKRNCWIRQDFLVLQQKDQLWQGETFKAGPNPTYDRELQRQRCNFLQRHG
jgi:hypothetical protein